jgi:hypothetical protein
MYSSSCGIPLPITMLTNRETSGELGSESDARTPCGWTMSLPRGRRRDVPLALDTTL